MTAAFISGGTLTTPSDEFFAGPFGVSLFGLWIRRSEVVSSFGILSAGPFSLLTSAASLVSTIPGVNAVGGSLLANTWYSVFVQVLYGAWDSINGDVIQQDNIDLYMDGSLLSVGTSAYPTFSDADGTTTYPLQVTGPDNTLSVQKLSANNNPNIPKAMGSVYSRLSYFYDWPMFRGNKTLGFTGKGSLVSAGAVVDGSPSPLPVSLWNHRR